MVWEEGRTAELIACSTGTKGGGDERMSRTRVGKNWREVGTEELKGTRVLIEESSLNKKIPAN